MPQVDSFEEALGKKPKLLPTESLVDASDDVRTLNSLVGEQYQEVEA